VSLLTNSKYPASPYSANIAGVNYPAAGQVSNDIYDKSNVIYEEQKARIRSQLDVLSQQEAQLIAGETPFLGPGGEKWTKEQALEYVKAKQREYQTEWDVLEQRQTEISSVQPTEIFYTGEKGEVLTRQQALAKYHETEMGLGITLKSYAEMEQEVMMGEDVPYSIQTIFGPKQITKEQALEYLSTKKSEVSQLIKEIQIKENEIFFIRELAPEWAGAGGTVLTKEQALAQLETGQQSIRVVQESLAEFGRTAFSYEDTERLKQLGDVRASKKTAESALTTLEDYQFRKVFVREWTPEEYEAAGYPSWWGESSTPDEKRYAFFAAKPADYSQYDLAFSGLLEKMRMSEAESGAWKTPKWVDRPMQAADTEEALARSLGLFKQHEEDTSLVGLGKVLLEAGAVAAIGLTAGAALPVVAGVLGGTGTALVMGGIGIYSTYEMGKELVEKGQDVLQGATTPFQFGKTAVMDVIAAATFAKGAKLMGREMETLRFKDFLKSEEATGYGRELATMERTEEISAVDQYYKNLIKTGEKSTMQVVANRLPSTQEGWSTGGMKALKPPPEYKVGVGKFSDAKPDAYRFPGEEPFGGKPEDLVNLRKMLGITGEEPVKIKIKTPKRETYKIEYRRPETKPFEETIRFEEPPKKPSEDIFNNKNLQKIATDEKVIVELGTSIRRGTIVSHPAATDVGFSTAVVPIFIPSTKQGADVFQTIDVGQPTRHDQDSQDTFIDVGQPTRFDQDTVIDVGQLIHTPQELKIDIGQQTQLKQDKFQKIDIGQLTEITPETITIRGLDTFTDIALIHGADESPGIDTFPDLDIPQGQQSKTKETFDFGPSKKKKKGGPSDEFDFGDMFGDMEIFGKTRRYKVGDPFKAAKGLGFKL
jgi:hypothetical protein